MFKILCENPEIRSFLNNFPSNHWRKAIVKVTIAGVQHFKSQNLPFTLSSLDELLTPNRNLSDTLDHLKQELKQITSSVKRLEKKTFSSSDLLKDHKINLNEINPKVELFEFKPRNYSCKSEKKVNLNENRNKTPGFLQQKEVKEPRICDLKDAQSLIKFLNVPKVISVNTGNDVTKVTSVSYFNSHRKKK